MKPETVLGIKYREEPTAKLQEWLKEYTVIAVEFPGVEDLAQRLSKRAEKAGDIITERNRPEPPSSSHDDMYYIEMAKIVDDENASFDGDFPLGNEADASFAGCYFSVPELAKMQCGLHHLIVAGSFNGYNFDVLVRKGFLAELYEDWPEAVRCYEGVPTSKSVQVREYECRRKMEIEDKRCYEKAAARLADSELTDTDISFWQQAAQLRNLEYPGKRPKKKIIKQHKKQMAWYRLAAEAGDTDAMNALSMAYHLGYPETRDDREAFLWASRAADAGDESAMYQAAYFYENGFGTDKDIDAALLLYTEAAEQGVRSAMIRLYEIYTEGLSHIQPDGQKAAHYLWLSGEEWE